MTINAHYKLVKRPEPLPPSKGPFLEVKLVGPAESVSVIGLLDSGADTCAIPRGTAQVLGLKLEKETVVVGVGGSLKAANSRMGIMVEGTHERHSLENVPVKVVLDEAGDLLPIILGRSGFFEAFEITFREKAQKISLKKTQE